MNTIIQWPIYKDHFKKAVKEGSSMIKSTFKPFLVFAYKHLLDRRCRDLFVEEQKHKDMAKSVPGWQVN